MGAMSIGHWVVVLLVVILVFGPKKLANLGKELGSGLKAFKEATVGQDDSADDK